jgi:hypothetical protein
MLAVSGDTQPVAAAINVILVVSKALQRHIRTATKENVRAAKSV